MKCGGYEVECMAHFEASFVDVACWEKGAMDVGRLL